MAFEVKPPAGKRIPDTDLSIYFAPVNHLIGGVWGHMVFVAVRG